MTSRSSAAIWAGALLVLPLLLAAAPRAGGRGGQASKPARKPALDAVTFEGTVSGIGPQQIQVQSNTDQQVWLVASQPTTKLLVKATATPDFLKAGMGVQIKATCDGKMLTGKVQELIVVPLIPERSGIYPGGAPPTLSLVPPEPKVKARGRKKGEPVATGPDMSAPGMCEIIGQLVSVHAEKLSVRVASNRNLAAELDDNTKILVFGNDGSAISVGDKIVVRGHVVRGQVGPCLADDVRVTHAAPLTGGKRQPGVGPGLPARNPKNSAKQKEDLPF